MQPARATWDTGYFQEAVYSLMLEKLGFEVLDHKEMDNPVFYKAVANGNVHFWANGWFPLHAQYKELYRDDVALAGVVVSGGALQGYLVDKAGADQYDITSLEDFKRPEVRAAYDHNGDGLADLYACPAGWGCHTEIGFQVAKIGLHTQINVITDKYADSMKTVIDKFGAGEPVLFYTWTPNWTLHELQVGGDVVWIEVPEVDQLPPLPDPISDVAGCVNNPCRMGFSSNDINVVANR